MWLTIDTFFQSQLGYPLHCAQFDVKHYTSQYFSDFGITFPTKLSGAVVKRQAEYLAGRVCAKNALLTFGVNDFQITSAENRAPIWPKNMCGSITHTQNIAAAAVTNNPNVSGLGIDIECVMEEEQEKELCSYIITPNEKSTFLKLSKLSSNPLTIIFSAKESIYKALYPTVRRFFDFNAVTLVEFDNNKLIFIINNQLSSNVPKGKLITVYYQKDTNFVFTEASF